MPTQTTDLFLLEDLEDGGAESWGEEAGNGMKPAAAHVQTVVQTASQH